MVTFCQVRYGWADGVGPPFRVNSLVHVGPHGGMRFLQRLRGGRGCRQVSEGRAGTRQENSWRKRSRCARGWGWGRGGRPSVWCGEGGGPGWRGSSEVMGSGCMAPRQTLQEMWKMAQKDYYAFFFLIEV